MHWDERRRHLRHVGAVRHRAVTARRRTCATLGIFSTKTPTTCSSLAGLACTLFTHGWHARSLHTAGMHALYTRLACTLFTHGWHARSSTRRTIMTASRCEFDGDIGMLSSSCDSDVEFDRDNINILCSPNEDFGGPNDEPFRMRVRSTFQRFLAQIKYSHI